ncbi:porin family protein [Duncaniella muris]|uniref:porin family protein n=1 Tax=Duncaniella muris TaxID=2094150 RepID=UPI0025A9896F|nr:porin family protein [Duncaniella muris]
MNIKRYIIGVLAVAFSFVGATAQVDRSLAVIKSMLLGFEYEVYAGTNIGGASPLPLPAEIREINSYSPELNLQIGATVTKWVDVQKKWGLSLGVRLETKGMETKAAVKNYGMAIIQDGATVSGRWTGMVQTRYHSQQLVFPLTAVFKAHKRLKVHAGPYVAFAFSNDFDGYVYDGYLREGDPTGPKISFEGDSRANYDFGDNLRHFQWGMQGGVTWTAYKHLLVNANLAWGCNDIFESSFKTVTFNLYPIYLNVGFGYLF